MAFNKEAFLRALKEDEEFRYAVLGLLGIDKVIQSIDENTKAIRALQGQVASLQEQFVSLQGEVKALQGQVASLQEQFVSLQEEVKALQLQMKSLQEQFVSLQGEVKALQGQVASLQEQVKSLQEQVLALQGQVAEHTKILSRHAEILDEHTKAIRELTSKINALGTRWGVVAEEAFRDSIKYLVEDLLKAYKASRWIYYDKDGVVYGHPSQVDVDVLVRDGEHILVEFKSYVDKSDVAELYRIGQLYEKANGVKPKLLIVASAIRKRAKELADELGIECRGSVLDY